MKCLKCIQVAYLKGFTKKFGFQNGLNSNKIYVENWGIDGQYTIKLCKEHSLNLLNQNIAAKHTKKMNDEIKIQSA